MQEGILGVGGQLFLSLGLELEDLKAPTKIAGFYFVIVLYCSVLQGRLFHPALLLL